jgi:hypothetical protein
MNVTGPFRTTLVLAAAVLFFAAGTPAQQRVASPNRVALQKFVDATSKLSPEVSKHLSHGIQNYLRYTNAVVNGAAPSAKVFAEKFLTSKKIPSGGNPFNLIQVSDPALDPATQGYTQNTSSSAWCGNAVVVGYEDSGAFYRTDPTLVSGVPISLDGVSFSTDAGKTFTDLGFLTPGTFSSNALIGDPVVTCSSPTHFQYASILNTTTADGLNHLIGPSVSLSNDGGKTWSKPLQVASLNGDTQIADSPWLAVDPTNPQRLYLSYTQIDPQICNSINVVTSADGGKTWSAPAIVHRECVPTQPPFHPENMVTGSRIVVAPDGKVHVAYEFFPGFSPDVPQINAIDFATSANHGATFSKPLKIADLVPSGSGAELNGHLLVDEYPQLAVDLSTGRSRGTVYVTYPDGRNHVVPDASSPSGKYAFPDIFVAKSINSGRSFTVLGAVSSTPKDFTGLGRDQFLPAIAVDNDGEVAVCYYDRRQDRPNLRVDRFCSVSETQGRIWKDQQASSVNWLPTMNVDPLNLGGGFGISEYDSLASDFLGQNDGFFGAFIIEINGHQNVVATKFGESETGQTDVAQTCSVSRCPVYPAAPFLSVDIEPREPRVDPSKGRPAHLLASVAQPILAVRQPMQGSISSRPRLQTRRLRREFISLPAAPPNNSSTPPPKYASHAHASHRSPGSRQTARP